MHQKYRRVKPTARDLDFDFTRTSVPICESCMWLQGCQTAALVNLPVVSCSYFQGSAASYRRRHAAEDLGVMVQGI